MEFKLLLCTRCALTVKNCLPENGELSFDDHNAFPLQEASCDTHAVTVAPVISTREILNMDTSDDLTLSTQDRIVGCKLRTGCTRVDSSFRDHLDCSSLTTLVSNICSVCARNWLEAASFSQTVSETTLPVWRSASQKPCLKPICCLSASL